MYVSTNLNERPQNTMLTSLNLKVLTIKSPYILYFFLLSVFLSCSSVKVKNLNTHGKEIRKIKNVSVIAQNEHIQHNGEKIADFVLKENPIFNDSYNINWHEVKAKMNELAISSGANLTEVNQIGYGIKGNVFYIDGNLFYSENLELKSKKNQPCTIVIFRDGMESLLGSAFTINKSIYDVKLSGEPKYYKVSKATSSNTAAGGAQIGIGGITLVEIKDKDLGRLMMFQHKNQNN